jgi:hypothetical protein
VICRIDGEAVRGRAVTLDRDVAPAVVARAVRDGTASDGEVTVTVSARQPHMVHERVGCLRRGIGLHVRTALAGAARARGWTTEYDAELERARAELAAFETGDAETKPARRVVASASAETDRLRERVAAMRGRLRARSEHGLDDQPARERLEEAARELSEAETRATAARQTLDRRRRDARSVRDDLEARLKLEDEVANLERSARAALVERARDVYAAAVATAPGGSTDPENPFDVDPLTAGLAVARVAGFDGPVVVACDRFGGARAASRWLGAPVVEI